MNYTFEIISLIAWPVMIYLCYVIAFRAIEAYEKNENETADK